MSETTMEGERCETIDELSGLLTIAQGMGQRLANETHGDAFAGVRDFNELLHRTCAQLELVRRRRRDAD